MAPKAKGGLGRGLGALFADTSDVPIEPAEGAAAGSAKRPRKSGSSTQADGEAVQYVGISDIKPNANQPRKNFDP